MSAAVPTTVIRPAALWRRFASMVYDVFPLLGLWIAMSGLWMLAFHRADDLQHLAAAVESSIDLVLRDLCLAVVTATYFAVSWVRVGATIGMRAWRLRLVRTDGARIDARVAWLRFVLALVSLAALGCGFWFAFFDAERRTWHDRVCGTRMLHW